MKVLSQTGPHGQLCCLDKTQIQLSVQLLEPMPWYMRRYNWMVAGVTGLSKFQVIINVLCIYGEIRGLMETLEDVTEE